MARSLRDGHTVYIDAETWREVYRHNDFIRPARPFWFRTHSTSEGWLVWDVEPGSNAAKAGLRVGDLVVEMNGVALAGNAAYRVQDTNRLVVMRSGRRVELEIKSETYSMRPFEARMIGEVAYFQLDSFPPEDWQSGEEKFRTNLASALWDLADEQPRGWILDLRNNGGGFLGTSALMAGYFGVHGHFAEVEDGSRRTPYDAIDKRLFSRWPPIAVLVNDRTASASEILAYSLQESRGAYVIGTRTRGSVRAPIPVALSRGGGLLISTTTIRVGRGKAILEGVGVVPDEALELDLTAVLEGRDNQLERAVEWISRPVE
jgi:carboxyl-terminal processing protease